MCMLESGPRVLQIIPKNGVVINIINPKLIWLIYGREPLRKNTAFNFEEGMSE